MAIARPVRALGLAAIVMWCFFVWQLMKPAPSSTIDQHRRMFPNERDPNLDRESPSPRTPPTLPPPPPPSP